jgi:hypothetical protein
MDDERLDKIEQSIARIVVNQDWIRSMLSNHIAHHDKYLYWVVGAIGTIGVGLVLNAMVG